MLHFWWSSKLYSFQSIKTSKMFQNLKSGDLLNFPQKSLGSDFTPSKMFYVSSKYYFLLFKFQKCQKILKNGKTGYFWLFSRLLLWL
jgi:hypothetical protein